MKRIIGSFLLLVVCTAAMAQQRVVAECTVTYSITLEDGAPDNEMTESLKSSVKTVYIKANNSRSDIMSPSFKQSLIYDKSAGTAVILREFGNNKFMTRLDNAKWTALNNAYEGMTINNLNETKTILGYECKKAELVLKDGSSFIIYYATNIVPSVKEFEYQFKDVPGFVLEYESKEGNSGKIRFTATKINTNPVQLSRFDIPTTGYRLLN
ncbi:DUF244 domain-containing protein [Sediminibacterium ginsengisoli]|uniref:GLPGLI family protein n=1 Tax=Sediminibacterium ginsengisoli TaxID=413434 RepID=A0A1T4PXG9_9BACT|nr:DUF244 domain-containing protein [Sediminibacterium ginsengisoli]SJZ96195.1 GLPGLI family protein [Sediminibacterium ginsengisoli]